MNSSACPAAASSADPVVAIRGASARIAMVSGEASGDLLGSHLIRALRSLIPEATFYGIGGPKMAAAGFDARFDAERLAVHGYADALRNFRGIHAIRRALAKELLAQPPDVFVGIDAPDFNLSLERRLKRRGVPTVHYVSPSIWAWRGGRIRKIGQSVGRMLTLFPFEAPIYEKQGIAVSYVGHPLADALPLSPDRASYRKRLGLAAEGRVIALLPGSRGGEIRHLGEIFVATANRLWQRFPGVRFLVPVVSAQTRTEVEAIRARVAMPGLPLTVMYGHSHEAMAAADAVLLASGTAALEAALLGRPMVIAYRMAPSSYQIMKRMAYMPYFGLPNVLAGRFVVPEFIQHEATPENLAQALGNIVDDPVVARRLEIVFRRMHLDLRQDSARRAAEVVLSYVGGVETSTCAVER
ncbi:MAG: lipid-A-disaccharide synthase [Betaproteobacteria bacterium]|nr:lipid-A-disaccharide synthase [Betaproteobacteria bacterium]